MKRTDTVIIGAGQAGLALSHCLIARGIDHVLLERGRTAERWRTARWDSLRLLTPNWMSRLPGWSYRGNDPEGFMTRDEVIDYLDGYAQSFAAPVEELTTVLRVAPQGGGWLVDTDRGCWSARNVVVATGDADQPRVPSWARHLSGDVLQLTPTAYRNARRLPPGGVLVAGASATGAQLAEELRRDGREVVLAVGRHNRLPRRYRGRDIMWWLDRTGSLDRSLADLPDPVAARHEPSLQLVGRPTAEDIDLGVLLAQGVRLAGRLVGLDGWRARFAADLVQTVADADARLERVLARIDRYVHGHALEARVAAAEPVARVRLLGNGPAELDLREAGITTVLWATGYRRDYSWLQAPVLDDAQEIRHHRGRTPLPGLYVLGLRFQTRRRSSFIDGVGRDAQEVAEAIAGASGDPRRAAA
jgi:putative flavoprotein involved in K+ transport